MTPPTSGSRLAVAHLGPRRPLRRWLPGPAATAPLGGWGGSLASWARTLGVLVPASGVLGVSPAYAQTPAPSGPTPVVTSTTSSVAGALVDSTLLPGRQDWTPYATPGRCLAAAWALERLAHRGADDSTGAHYQPEAPLPAAVVRVARRCGARFTLGTVAPPDLLDLAQLALLAGDDIGARAAAAQYVAAVTEPAAHRWALYAVDTMYLHARPMRRAEAEAVTARLDSLGPAAALQRTLAHEGLRDDARARYDVERLRRETLALLAACHQQSPQDSLDVEGGSCSEPSLVLELFLVELYASPAGAVARTRQLVSATGFSDWPTFQTLLRITRLEWAVAQSGQPVPPLVAPHWVGPQGRAPGWPVRGKVSIYLRGNLALDAPKTMARWTQLAAEFKDALDITVLVPLRGYFQVGGAAGGPPLTPAAEAARVAQFYREQLGVPVTVALLETPVMQLPPPDGRRLLGEPPLQKDPFYGSEFLLVDRDGKFLLGPVVFEEPLVRAWVARAVGP